MQNEKQSNRPGLFFAPLALEDVRETWQYLAEFGDEIAADLIRAIIKTCNTISQNPEMGRDRTDLLAGLRQFPYRNYNIFYFLTENGVEIYRVLHSSRDIVQLFDDARDNFE